MDSNIGFAEYAIAFLHLFYSIPVYCLMTIISTIPKTPWQGFVKALLITIELTKMYRRLDRVIVAFRNRLDSTFFSALLRLISVFFVISKMNTSVNNGLFYLFFMDAYAYIIGPSSIPFEGKMVGIAVFIYNYLLFHFILKNVNAINLF